MPTLEVFFVFIPPPPPQVLSPRRRRSENQSTVDTRIMLSSVREWLSSTLGFASQVAEDQRLIEDLDRQIAYGSIEGSKGQAQQQQQQQQQQASEERQQPTQKQICFTFTTLTLRPQILL